MSDVERIVNANHERVRWAEEYEGGRIATAPMGPRNDRRCTVAPVPGGHGPDRPTDWERRKAYRATALGCAMLTGGASAFVGIGLSTGNLLTAGVGLLVGALFLSCGSWAERLAEGADA